MISLKFKRVSILFGAVVLLSQSHTPSVQAASKVQFSIVYTNDVMGEVEPCG